MRYGCVPIVRRTGGLVDTVLHHDPEHDLGTGYCFDRYEPLDLFTCMVRTSEAYRFKPQWTTLQQRGMEQDFSWERSAQEYAALYHKIKGLPLPPIGAGPLQEAL
jgi:starch synthase